MSADNEFTFPNQISLINNQVFVADTNNHRIVKIDNADLTFGQPLFSFIATTNKRRWPHQFTFDGEHFWVNIADSNMAFGQIAKFDVNGRQVKTVHLPLSPDPFALTFWQQQVWLTDFETGRIERISMQDQSLGIFLLPEFIELEKTAQAQKTKGEEVSLYGAVLFGFVLIGGFIAAFKLENEQTKYTFKQLTKNATDLAIEQAQRDNSEPQPALSNAKTVWVTNRVVKYKKRIMLFLFAFSTLLFISVVGFAIALYQHNLATGALDHSLIPLLILSLFMFIMLKMMLTLTNRLNLAEIGVKGDQLIVKQGEKEDLLALNQVRYSPTYLITKQICMPIAHGQMKLFDSQEMSRYVFSQLKTQNKLVGFALFKHLWQQKEPLFTSQLIFISSVIVVGVALQFFI
nr:hypothetical protein [Marinifaba aquimaris]